MKVREHGTGQKSDDPPYSRDFVILRSEARNGAEGKPKPLVFNNIANKLLRVLCGMIKNKEPYIENYQSVHPRQRATGTGS
jgi:hypothetical protein